MADKSWYGSRMRVARVQMPDGRIARVEVPEDAHPDQIAAFAHSAVQQAQAATPPTKPSQPAPASFMDQAKNAVGNVVGGTVEGALGLPDILWDAATGVRRVVNQGVGAAGSGALRAVGADKAADWWQRGSQGVEGDLSRMARPSTPITNMTPAPQDTAGKIARFGAQMLGGAAVPLGPKITPPSRFPTARAPAKNAPDLALVRAGQRQNIPVRRPDAIPSMRADMAAAEASQYAGPHVARTLDADRSAIQARLGELAGSGNVQSEGYNLGQQIQRVGTDYIKKTGEQAKRAYGQVDQLAAGQRINPQQAIAAIDDNIAELSASGQYSNSATIQYLQGLRGDLAKTDGFSVPEFQALRSAARKKISGSPELTSSDAERRLSGVVRAFSGDARQQLPKEAADLLDNTDAFYADRMGFIKGVLQKHVLGRRNNPLSPEAAAKNLNAMAKNRADYDAFSNFWGKADPQTQADFTATFADGLGSARNGQFGLGTLASDIEKVPQNIRQTMFGETGAQNLDDLRQLALAKSGTAGGLNNSRTGPVMARQVMKRVLPSIGAGYLAGGPIGAVAGPALTEGAAAAGQFYKAGRLLDPDWAKALAQASAPSLDEVAQPYVSRLPGLLASSPAVRNEYSPLASLLAGRNVAPLAADDPEHKKKKKR